jgi:hypothetical protein
MGNVKVQVPQLFSWQPGIAFGITDVGGQTHFFRSKYGVLTEELGPLSLTAGYGHGDRLNGVFGGGSLSVLRTGISVLAEDDAKTPYAGVRYESPAISWLAGSSIVGTVMRALRRTDDVAPRTSFSVGIRIPLGRRFDEKRCANGLCEGDMARRATADADTREMGAAPAGAGNEDTAAAPAATANTAVLRELTVLRTPEEGATPVAEPALGSTAAESTAATLPDVPEIVPAELDSSPLEVIFRRLIDAGLERVRVGIIGHDLIIEYENHRYGQNEADALGIVLGVAAENAPPGINEVRAIIKKAGEPLGEVSVSRAAYVQFLEGGSPAGARSSLTMRMSPTYDDNSVTWYGNARFHGLTRVEISPVANYLYGTEYGNFDVSVGANVQVYVPLWRGAELFSSAIAPIANTRNMDNGRVFSDDRLRGGLAAAGLAQTFWIAPRVLNVASIGKFDFDYLGIENQTIAFVPGRDDLVRLQLAYLHHEPGDQSLPSEKEAALTYRLVLPSWKLWFEAGGARFVGGDKGPVATMTRWFDDFSVSLSGSHSGRGSFVEASISFPLTPRQGMKPGITQISGTSQFDPSFRTEVGHTNYVSNTGSETLDFTYDAQRDLINDGRFGPGYFAGELYRMRDAYLRYGKPSAGTSPSPSQAASIPAPAAQAEPALCPADTDTLREGGRLLTTHCQ